MDVGDYLLGSSALAIGLLPWIPASRRLVRRLVPDWTGPAAALGASLVGTTGVIVVAELLGLVGGFRRWPFAFVSAFGALLVARLGVAAPPSPQPPGRLRLPRSRGGWIMLGCVVVCVMTTTTTFAARDASVLQTGSLDTDSLHYHLTQAAEIVHTHSDLHLHHTASSDGSVFYPYDAELLDAVAMLGPHPDIATFGLNLLFGWLALLACWVIGARWSSGPTALAAGAAVLALPLVSQASTGPGLNDVPSMAFVLAGVACVAMAGAPRAGRPRNVWLAELAMAGLGLGLAAGTKLSALAIVVLVALAVVALASGDRARAAVALFVPAFLAGGFWYVRNWVSVGSPVPDTDLTVAGHGFHVVPYPEVKPYDFSVAHYLGNGSVLGDWFVPELRTVWTDLWPAVLVLFLGGVLLSVFAERLMLRRLLGIAVLGGLVAYLVTPTTALGASGHPLLFGTNTRYLFPVLVLAFVLVATSSVLRRYSVQLTVLFTTLMIVLLSLEDLPQTMRTWTGVAAAVALAAIVAWLLATRSEAALRPVRRVFVAALVLLCVVSGGALQRSYLDHRYAGQGRLQQLFAVVGGYQHQRIGVVGHGLEYPFYGPDFSNTVNYVGVEGRSHAFDLPMTCPDLLIALSRLHDDYVVVEPLEVEHTARVDGWIAALPGVRKLFGSTAGNVYQMPAVIPSNGCAPPT